MSAYNVAVVYGSFQNGDCERDAKTVAEKFPQVLQIAGYDIYAPVEGNEFHFDLVKDLKEMYEDTYMNMPRYMDILLEKCGSRRFYARGEFGEPNAALNTDKCECAAWSEGMWLALTDTIAADGDQQSWPIAEWASLWAQKPSLVHHNVTEWGEKELEKAFKKAELVLPPPSAFAKL